MRMWRSGSASPCQGEGREFESRHPLEYRTLRRTEDSPKRNPTDPGAHGDVNLSTVGWPRGEAAACKAVYAGSNPVPTSNACRSSERLSSLGDWRSGSALP
jgi:hypothetical protein